MIPALYAAGGAATAVLAVLALAGWAWRKLGRPVRDFLADWRGQPARPGVSERPGVMRRLEHIERHIGNGTDQPLRELVVTTERRVAALEQYHKEGR